MPGDGGGRTVAVTVTVRVPGSRPLSAAPLPAVSLAAVTVGTGTSGIVTVVGVVTVAGVMGATVARPLSLAVAGPLSAAPVLPLSAVAAVPLSSAAAVPLSVVWAVAVADVVPLAGAVPPAAVTRRVGERVSVVAGILPPPVPGRLPRRVAARGRGVPVTLRRSTAGTSVLAVRNRTTTLATQTAQAPRTAGVSRRPIRTGAVGALVRATAVGTTFVDIAVPSGAASEALFEAVAGTGARAVAGTVSGGRPAGRLGRRVRGLVCRHRPIIARTKEAHCSPRHMSR